ncbi:MAG: hypothetical protein KGJ86_07445 [Chloroflexota bacterium]|nr:hypothetical protein [Chloroflexota bacterium]
MLQARDRQTFKDYPLPLDAAAQPASGVGAAEDCGGKRRGWSLGAEALVVLALVAASGLAAAPLVRGPIFASADGLFHVYRLVEFDRVFRSGVVYPRWAPDLMAGYGYPIFTFQAPLQYYLAELAHLAGLGFVDGIKLVVALGMVASVLGMYLLGRELWGPAGGFLSAIAYLYVPYRLVNTYLDGELSQTLAWAWLPWLLWACWRFLEVPSRVPSAEGRVPSAECRVPSAECRVPGAE